MSFLYPGFLFALLTLAIPILIHLFHFRKFKKVYFSNVAFLTEVELQRSSREKLRNLLLLLARLLTLFFLVLAFARPYWASNNSQQLGLNQQISVYIDNSYSMGRLNGEGTLLDEAKRKAKELASQYAINDRFQLLTNDFEARHQRLLNREEFVDALDDIKLSASNKTLEQVLNRQLAVFSGQATKRVYLISDFQRNFVGEQQINKPTNLDINLVQLRAEATPNLSVDSVWFLSPTHLPQQAEALVIRLKNFGQVQAKNIPVKLHINGQQKAMALVNVAPNASSTDTLRFTNNAKGWQQAVLSLRDYPISFDDDLYFSYPLSQQIKVLAINGTGQGQNLSALFAADKFFRFTAMPDNKIDYGLFAYQNLIVLNGVQQTTTGLAQELKKFVNQGGSLVILPSTQADASCYNTFLAALSLPMVKSLQTEATKVSSIELKNQLFEGVFDQLPQEIDLPLLHRHWQYQQTNNSHREDILLLPLKQAFLARYTLQKGNCYLFASGLDTQDGNLAKHPILLPLLYRMAFLSQQELPLFYTLSHDLTVKLPLGSVAQNLALQLTGQAQQITPTTERGLGENRIYLADQIQLSGFYELKDSDSLLAIIAVNNDRKESDLSFLDKKALKELFPQHQPNIVTASEQNANTIAIQKNNGQEFWKLCLILSLIFMLIEVLLLRFFNLSKK